MSSINRPGKPKWPALMSALVVASWIPAGAWAERGHGGEDRSEHGGDREHGGGEHGGGDHGGGDHGGGDHGGGDHGGGDHGGGDHGGGDHGGGDHGGGDDHGGSDDRGGGGGSGDHGGGGSDDHGGGGGSDDHGGGGGSDDHGGGGSDDHGGSGGGSNDHGGSDDHGGSGGSDDHGGSGSGSDDHGGSDQGSGGHGSDEAGGEDHGGSSGSSGSGGGSDDHGGSSGGSGGSGGSSETAGAADVARRGDVDIALDREGREYRSREIVVFGDEHTVAAAERLGLALRGREDLSSIGGSILRLEAPEGRSAESLLSALKAAAPEAASDLNSVYRPAGSLAVQAPRAGRGGRAVVGLADTSVDLSAPGLARTVIQTRSFAPGGAESPLHGTVVASLITRSGADVIAADVFSADRAGNPAASADAIARALDWLLSRGVTVVNLSLAGPPNAALAEVIRRAQARGGVVVAAAGNGGPAAPPAYPAAYPGVVAVTAVDGSGRVYRYANQGGYIVVAARGVDLTPMPGHTLSGTSYASPSVAAMLARQRLARGPQASAAAIEQLRRQARDLGPPGRDPIYGYGLVGSAGF